MSESVSILDQIQSEEVSYKVIEVPEWTRNDQPLKIYARPLTLGMLSKIQARAKGDDSKSVVWTLIYTAMDGQGEAIFNAADAKRLLNMDYRIITRVVAEMGESDSEDLGND